MSTARWSFSSTVQTFGAGGVGVVIASSHAARGQTRRSRSPPSRRRRSGRWPGKGGPLSQASDLIDAYVKARSEEHTSELQSHSDLVCRLLLEKKKEKNADRIM